MLLKIISTAVILCLSLVATAQLPVREEPRHHLVFENEYVRILDVHLKPGDTTEYHLHNTPSVFILLTSTATGSQLYGQGISIGTSEAKSIDYDSLNKPRYHRVWNEDNTWFHVNDVELTGKGPFKNISLIRLPALRLLFNEKQVNIYKLTLNANEKFLIPASSPGYLLYSLDDATVTIQTGSSVQTRIMKPGHYIWIDAGAKTVISLITGKTNEFALLQLK